ncbi:putative peptidoglycan lipid II flippase [Actinomadura hallensis]|uniref:Putative peptidoglycan lipid II flippase n=1 Tax=Actinomadura hallensis TaxID=337895 RepID=A0A543IG13_9ACTN|nr:lipid II flippase MurJ [Actinomadura hallensis]TQM69526.1 putative peptidoglycan lipid II flippase [Actinomadura hallensis]HLV74561.1 lipid II flippase MurJ [Vulgatibacteraceae bacterium]
MPPSTLRRLTGGLAGAAVVIAVITVLSRLAGFGRTYAFSQTVTTSCLSQAYFTSTQFPFIVYEIVAGGALTAMVVPVLAGAAERGDRDEVRRIGSALLTWIVVLMIPLSALMALAARPIMELLVGGDLQGCSRDGIVDVGSSMLRILSAQMVMYGVAVVLYGVLQSHRRFVAPALAPLMSSLVVIVAYAAYAPLGRGYENDLAGLPLSAELTLSVGTALGGVAMAATAGIAAWRLRLGLRPTLRFPDGVARKVRRLAAAGLATVAAQQLSALLVVRLSYEGTGGALANYQYAWAIYLLPWAILAVPIATSAFPALSARMSDGDHERFDRMTASTSRAVVLVSCAGAAVLAAVAGPVAAVFNPGLPDQQDVLSRAVLAFAPGLVGYGLVAHLGRVLYACHRGRAGAAAVVTGWLVVMAADVALVLTVDRDWVVAALGAGNAAGMTVAGVLLVAVLVRVRGAAAVAGLPRALAAGLAGAAAGGAAGHAAAAALGAGGQLHAIGTGALAALAAGAVFLLTAYLIDGRDLRSVLTRKVTRDV